MRIIFSGPLGSSVSFLAILKIQYSLSQDKGAWPVLRISLLVIYLITGSNKPDLLFTFLCLFLASKGTNYRVRSF